MNPLTLIAALMFAGVLDPVQPRKTKGSPVIKAFNAFQIVALFAAMPHIIGYLHSEPFAYSTGALWVSLAVYVVMFFGLIYTVFESMDKK